VTRSPRQLLIGAGICAGLFAILLVLAYVSGGPRWIDASALQGFVSLQGPRFDAVTVRVTGLGDPFEVALIGAALATIALARGRPRVAIAVVVLIAVTSVSSQLLKELLAYPRDIDLFTNREHFGAAAFPSGHSTAAMALALAGVMVAPHRYRRLAAFVGAGLALAVAFSVIAQGWHFPSDAAGGFLLATGWALVIAAAVAAAPGPRRVPERVERAVDRLTGIGLGATALAGVALAVAVTVALVLTRLQDLAGFARDHTAVLPVAAALVMAAAGLLAAASSLLSTRR